jgi:hypothetical protein
MEISAVFQIENPKIFVPWGISDEQLKKLFQGYDLRKITNGYFVIGCESLGGLCHQLGFPL